MNFIKFLFIKIFIIYPFFIYCTNTKPKSILKKNVQKNDSGRHIDFELEKNTILLYNKNSQITDKDYKIIHINSFDNQISYGENIDKLLNNQKNLIITGKKKYRYLPTKNINNNKNINSCCNCCCRYKT